MNQESRYAAVWKLWPTSSRKEGPIQDELVAGLEKLVEGIIGT
jgi:hypothetical protein